MRDTIQDHGRQNQADHSKEQVNKTTHIHKGTDMKNIILIIALVVSTYTAHAQGVIDNLLEGNCDDLTLVATLGDSRRVVTYKMGNNYMKPSEVTKEDSPSVSYATDNAALISVVAFDELGTAETITLYIEYESKSKADKAIFAVNSKLDENYERESAGFHMKECGKDETITAKASTVKLGNSWYISLMLSRKES